MVELSVERIRESYRGAPARTLVAWWLGQAGFLLGTRVGPLVAIDPYLSNSCAVSHGLERRVPVPVSGSQLPADVVLFTHVHPDHFDPETVWMFCERSEITLVAPPSCIKRCRAFGIPENRLVEVTPGSAPRFGNVLVDVVTAVHMPPGAGCEDAVGYHVVFDGISVYHTGDTEYGSALRAMVPVPVDVMFTCFNGSGGNMDAEEAGWFASRVAPRLLVPMHFGMFDYSGIPGAANDPSEVLDVYRRYAPLGRVEVPRVGAPLQYESAE